MRAEIDVECGNPGVIIRSITPDAGANERFTASLRAEKNSVKLSVEANDVTGLLAGINSYLRLIKTASDVSEID